MNQDDYENILFEALANHEGYLSECIFREWKKASVLGVSIDEYFQRIEQARKYLVNEIDRNYNDRLKNYHLLKEKEAELPKEQWYNCPLPIRDQIGLSMFSLSQGKFNYPSQIYLKHLIELENSIIDAKNQIGVENSQVNQPYNDNNKDRNKEFTTARQALALHFIFEQLQVRPTEIDRSVRARFVEFLTGKSYKNIYDALQEPFLTKEKAFRFEDLQFIRKYFEDLGLAEIVKAINNQLDKPR